MNAPGKTMLKVVSIIYIVIGAICALLMILSLFFGSLLASIAGNIFGALGGLLGGALFIVFLIPAAADLIIGIIGVKFCDDPSKASFFIVVGFIMSGLMLISLFGAFSIWNLIGLILPILYIVGGFRNKNAVPAA
jgi:hypothetical protein